MAQGFGTKDRPVNLDPFQLIVGVGWTTGGVVVVELEFCRDVQGLDVQILSPSPNDIFMPRNGHSFSSILYADYKDDPDWYAKEVGDAEVIQEHIVTEDPLDVWIWDIFYIQQLPSSISDPILAERQRMENEAAVARITLTDGPFDFHFEGMQIAYDTVHLGRPLLGDYVTYTHPSGHMVTYAQGATPIPRGYVGWHSPTGGGDYTGVNIRPDDPNGFPEPPQDLSVTESWYWYHTQHIPGHDTDKIRQAWLIYFASDRAHSAEIINYYASSITEIMHYNIRGYPVGTEFDVSHGHITPKPIDGVIPPPLWEVNENASPAIAGQLKRFGPKGIVV